MADTARPKASIPPARPRAERARAGASNAGRSARSHCAGRGARGRERGSVADASYVELSAVFPPDRLPWRERAIAFIFRRAERLGPRGAQRGSVEWAWGERRGASRKHGNIASPDANLPDSARNATLLRAQPRRNFWSCSELQTRAQRRRTRRLSAVPWYMQQSAQAIRQERNLYPHARCKRRAAG